MTGETHDRIVLPKEIVGRLCQLQSEVSELLGYDEPADCFCRDPDHGGLGHEVGENYRNYGRSLRFIEAAVREALGVKKGLETASDPSVPDGEVWFVCGIRNRVVGRIVGLPEEEEGAS